MQTSDFLKGTLSTIILSLLNEHGKMYGYEICTKTKELSKNHVILTEGAIYPSLHKLEKKGIITSSKEKVNGRIRKYYSIAEAKESFVTDQINALETFIHSLNLILKSN